MRCRELLPPAFSVQAVWNSAKQAGNEFLYQTDAAVFSAEQLAVLILYPFWSRMGGSFADKFLESGQLRNFLLTLKKKSDVLQRCAE